MILSNNNGTFTPVAGGTGTFIGTAAAFNAVKATLPVNTVAYITDDGNGDLQPVDAVTNGDMHPVTSNAVYDKLQAFLKLTSIIIDSNQFAQSPNYPQRYDISIPIPTPPAGYTTCIGGVLGVAWFSSNIYCQLEIYERIKAPENGAISFAVCTPDMATIQQTAFRLTFIWSK